MNLKQRVQSYWDKIIFSIESIGYNIMSAWEYGRKKGLEIRRKQEKRLFEQYGGQQYKIVDEEKKER